MSTIPESEFNTLDVNLLVSIFQKIEPQANEFVESFYNILFGNCPQIQILFLTTDIEKQKYKLMELLKLVVLNIHNPALSSLLHGIGARHVGYGAELTDYPLFGDALLQALENTWIEIGTSEFDKHGFLYLK